ncbi:MAG TPA: VOC family protein [Chloroflexota bacterium]|nr:VOC family protein [Chloroflexota bacterium]
MIRRIDHVGVPVADYAAAVSFYRDVLGFELYSEKALGGPPPRRIAYLRPPAGDAVIEVVEEVDTDGTGPHYCLEVADMDAAVARLTTAGLRVVSPPRPTEPRAPREEGWGRAVLAGPAGELIELRG